jgi:hypothetical protein
LQIGILNGLFRRDKGERDGSRDVLAIPRMQCFERVDPPDFAGDLDRTVRRIERTNARDSAAGVAKAVPQSFATVA